MITATRYPLTRRALAAWPRWRESEGLARRNWERHCGLTDAEISALEQLQANLEKLGPAKEWFDPDHAHVRPRVVPGLLIGLRLAERDLAQYVRGLALGNGFHQQWLEAAIRKELAEEWKQAQAAQQREDRNRAEQREARERAQAEAEAAAVLERQRQAQREWEQKQSEREQAQRAQEKPMETATLNGTGSHTLEKPAGLTELQSDVWDALRERHMNPRVDISTMTKRDIARQVNSTEGSVGAALSVIRRRLREEADGHLQALPDAAPAEAVVPEPAASTEAVGTSAEPVDVEAVPSAHTESVAPTFPDPRHWEGEQRLKELSEQCAAQLQMIASLDEQAKRLEQRVAELTETATTATRERDQTAQMAAGLEAELEQVIGDRAKAWEELHDLKNGAQPVSIEPATITPEMERQAKAMFPELTRVQLTMDDQRLALDLAAGCDVSEGLCDRPLDIRAEILRKAADAVEVVLA